MAYEMKIIEVRKKCFQCRIISSESSESQSSDVPQALDQLSHNEIFEVIRRKVPLLLDTLLHELTDLVCSRMQVIEVVIQVGTCVREQRDPALRGGTLCDDGEQGETVWRLTEGELLSSEVGRDRGAVLDALARVLYGLVGTRPVALAALAALVVRVEPAADPKHSREGEVHGVAQSIGHGGEETRVVEERLKRERVAEAEERVEGRRSVKCYGVPEASA